MDKSAVKELLKELQTKYVNAWPLSRGTKIGKGVVLDEPVIIEGLTIPVGTETKFYPPQRKKPYSAVIFYEEERHTTIMNDGTVVSRPAGGKGKKRATPRLPKLY